MSGVDKVDSQGHGGVYVPSWVGPMPPEVTTKSYLSTNRRLASMLIRSEGVVRIK